MGEGQQLNGLLGLALQAFENIDDAVITYDENGHVTGWNRAAEIIYDISHETALDQKIDQILHIEDESVSHEDIRREVQQKGSWRGELQQRSKSGKRVWVDWSIAMLIFPEIGPVGMISITKDITERKTVEEKLRDSEARYRLLANNSNDVIWVRDLNLKIQYISPSVENQLGYTVEEATALKTEQLLTPDSLNKAMALLAKALELGKKHHIMELEHVHKNGQRLWIEINARMLHDEEGNPISLLGVSRDITKRKRAENLLRLQRDLALKLGETISLEEMVRQCLAISIESGQMDCGAIFLVSEEDAELRYTDSLGNSRAFVKEVQQGEVAALLTKILKDGKPRYDLFHTFNLPLNVPTRESKLRATAVLPLVYQDRIVGSLSLASYSKNEIPHFIRQALEAIASQIASSIARKRAEDRLQRSEDRLRAYVEAIPDLSVVFDEEGKFIEIVSNENNPYLKQLREAKGFYIKDYVSSTDEKEFLRVISKTLESGQSQRMEYPIHAPGKVLWFEATTSVLHYAFGEKRHVLWMARETTERREASLALQASEQRIQALLNAPVDSAILIDRQGNIQALNDVAGQKLAGSISELKGQCLYSFLPEPLRSDRRRKYETVFSKKKPLRFEDSHSQTVYDNSVYPVFDENKNVEALAVYTRDITHIRSFEKEKRRMEAQLRHQQKLESIGTLASGVAHEINNPINIIMNYGELILDEVDRKKNVIGDYSREIISEGQRISDIVRNLLAFSRQEQETFSRANPKEIIESTLTLVSKILQKDQIELESRVENDLPMVRCNKQQMMQVLMNLLTNARDALNQRFPKPDPQKKVILHARVQEAIRKKWVRIEVEDYGIGMSKEVAERIFDPFFTTKSRANGTGLGLSISHGIMLENKGRLSFSTEPNKGSIFVMELNAEDE